MQRTDANAAPFCRSYFVTTFVCTDVAFAHLYSDRDSDSDRDSRADQLSVNTPADALPNHEPTDDAAISDSKWPFESDACSVKLGLGYS